MENNIKPDPGNGMIVLLILINTIVLKEGFMGNRSWYWILIFTMPLLFTGFRFLLKHK